MKKNVDVLKRIKLGDNIDQYIELAEKILAGNVPLPKPFEKYFRILKAIRWENENGVPMPVSSWTYSKRMALIKMFIDIVKRSKPRGCFIPQNMLANSLGDDVYPTTVLYPKDAWRIFLSHVANSLYMEISNNLSWSMRTYSPEELTLLLDSRSFFRWAPEHSGYIIRSDETGHITPTDARCLSRYVENTGPGGLIASNAVDTIANVLECCRHYLVHFMGYFRAGNVESIWNYRGFPPICRMISTGTTAGCWGTVGFIQAVLRNVNIPVKPNILAFTTSAHDSCYFITEATYTSHGDDCYNMLVYSTPPFPAKELMFDQQTYDSWFDYPTVPGDTCQNNIGRQVGELALKYLPDYLLKLYCDDISNNRQPNNGQVMSLFSRWYTFQELWNAGLWPRLLVKVNSFGGCQNLPHSYDSTSRPLLPWKAY